MYVLNEVSCSSSSPKILGAHFRSNLLIGFAISVKYLMKQRKTLKKPRNERRLDRLVVCLASRRHFVSDWSIYNRPGLMIWPRQSTEAVKKRLFLRLSVTTTSPSVVKTWSTWWRCSSISLENLMISPIHTRQVLQMYLLRMNCSTGWNVDGTFVSPNG